MQNYSELPEDELLTLLISGNKLAFKQIYKIHYRGIYAYALNFTKSTFLAEDITQEVFLKIWESRRSLDEIRQLKSYLFTMCKNMTLNMLARAARENRVKEYILAGAQKFHLDPENKIQNEEYEALLRHAIEQLPPQRQLIFKLVKLEGKSYEEVADQLGIATGTINDHIVKATRSIRAFLCRYNITLTHLLLFHMLHYPVLNQCVTSQI